MMLRTCRSASLLLACSSPLLAQTATVLHPRALLLNFDPIIESRSGQRLHVVGGWSDPTTLTNGYVSDFQTVSHGMLMYRLSRVLNLDVWPIKADGFRYTDSSYLQCLQTGTGWHTPDICDYKAVARDFDLARKVDSGEIEEVFNHSGPYFGGWETHMLGRGGYWCNSGPEPRIACSKIFIVSVFNYERGVGEMEEDFGHRSESILNHVYGSWGVDKNHLWDRFTLYDQEWPGQAACGNVHFAPNSTSDYDWGNTRYVNSTADYWLNTFPSNYPVGIDAATRSMNCSEWGYGDIRLHHKWWFNHFPHADGSITEYGMTRLNNWWAYVQDFNTHAESGGDHVPGGPAPAATPYPTAPRAVTATAYDNWAPHVSAGGRLVWHGSDGNDFEIYSADAAGGATVRITNNSYADEDPKINASGRIVWQSFDGQDYEIYCANADGSNVVRITNNVYNDWHPQINNLGRIVWDGFDGTDYEIFSANSDGTNVVQITNNNASSGYPLEDVWPQINNNNRVVWSGYDGAHWQIYSANADGTGLVNISNNTYENEYPQINDNGRVVWQAWLDDVNCEIFSTNATGGTVTRLTNNAYEDWYPQINNAGTVVWMARKPSSWEIMSIPATGGTATQITNNTTHDQYPQINSSGQIVWQGFDGHDWEIYTLKNGVIYQVTNNDYDDRWPQINDDGLITWHADSAPGSSGNTSQIFAAFWVEPIPGDFDNDRDVDQLDFGHLQECFTAGAMVPPGPGCEDADLGGNPGVDSEDVNIFLKCMTQPAIPGDASCAN